MAKPSIPSVGSNGSPEFRHVTKSSDDLGTGHNLGPQVVGVRVVVRRFVRGETGPSGGPAFTDLLGICETWGPESLTIRSEDGTLTEIPLADVVSGKPVPPRPSRFRRLSDAEVDARCDALRGAPAPQGPVDVQLVGVARLIRTLGETSGGNIEITEPAEGELVVGVGFDSVTIARATARYDDSWALLTELTVLPDHRRRGVRRLLLAALADALAERGLSVLAGEIPAEDAAARGLASALGFERHHTRG